MPRGRPGRGPGSGDRGRDVDALAVKMLDEQEDRAGEIMQEFDPDVVALAVVVLSRPHDLPIDLEGRIGASEVDDDPDHIADREVLPAADPGPGHRDVLGV